MEQITITSPNESFESRASINDNMSDDLRETDISENWEDRSTTALPETESGFTTNTKEFETTTSIVLNNKDNQIQNKQLPGEKGEITVEPKVTDGKLESTTEAFTDGTFESTTNNIFFTTSPVANTNLTKVMKESKDFSIDIPFDNTDKSQIKNQTQFGKQLEDPEGKAIIIDKIKDIIASKLQPAKIKKKHDMPETYNCRRLAIFFS